MPTHKCINWNGNPEHCRKIISGPERHSTLEESIEHHHDPEWRKYHVTPATAPFFRRWYRFMCEEARARGLKIELRNPTDVHRYPR